MSGAFSVVVPAPVDEVFAWHARAGAMTRLTPPWAPLRVGSEASSLESGRAVLLLPARLRWVAQHDRHAYVLNRRFVDEIAPVGLTSRALRAVLGWRHTHEFEQVDDSHTRVTDRVETRVPADALAQTFAYRQRQLKDDLQSHRWAAERTHPMTVAVTGSSGLIGTALTAFLSSGGHRVIRLVRRDPRTPDERRWNPSDPDDDLLDGVEAVVHLAGASIAGRFTAAHKRNIRHSRTGPTRRLAELAAATDDGPHIFISASGIGYYGADRGDELLTEDSPPGSGFLADTVIDWENATHAAHQAGLRVVHVRTGVVQSPRGGTLQIFRPLFQAGLGGRLGNGDQWLSWIDLDDLIDIYLRALTDTNLTGPVNAVAPQPVRNSEYTHTLASVLHRPALLPVPRLGPRLILGKQGGQELPEANQNVTPGRLQAAGHRFRHPGLEESLRHQLGRIRFDGN
ncbi:TIGR01777 family oxidoreductase [Arthrobacter monumenti]